MAEFNKCLSGTGAVQRYFQRRTGQKENSRRKMGSGEGWGTPARPVQC